MRGLNAMVNCKLVRVRPQDILIVCKKGIQNV